MPGTNKKQRFLTIILLLIFILILTVSTQVDIVASDADILSRALCEDGTVLAPVAVAVVFSFLLAWGFEQLSECYLCSGKVVCLD
jgi:hypothetical protein